MAINQLINQSINQSIYLSPNVHPHRRLHPFHLHRAPRLRLRPHRHLRHRRPHPRSYRC